MLPSDPTAPYLPPELIDLVLHSFPLQDPLPSELPFLLSLRLTCHRVNDTLVPNLFRRIHFVSTDQTKPNISSSTGNQRSNNPALRLAAFQASAPHLLSHIQTLKLFLPPAPNTQPHNLPATPASYFSYLSFILPHVLSPLTNLHTLHLTALPHTANDDDRNGSTGIPGLRGNTYVGWDYRSTNFLAQCLVALADGVGAAGLKKLQSVVLGMPYAGGYGDFFGVEGKRLGVRGRVYAPRNVGASLRRKGERMGWVNGAGGVNGAIGEAWAGRGRGEYMGNGIAGDATGMGTREAEEEEEEDTMGEVKVMLFNSSGDYTIMPVL